MTANFDDFPMTAREFAENLTIQQMSPDVWQNMVENLGYDKAEECARDLEQTGRDLLMAIPDRKLDTEAAVHFTMFVSTLAFIEMWDGLERSGEDPRPSS